MEGLGFGVDDVKSFIDKSQWRIRPGFFMGLLICFLLLTMASLFLPALVGGGPSKTGITRSRAISLWSGLNGYKDVFGNCPVGNNAEVTKVLLGNNPSHKIFVHPDSRRPSAIDEHGQYLDGFGIPFQMDFVSTNSVLIRSAGIDKIFGNKDDIVFDSISNSFVKQ